MKKIFQNAFLFVLLEVTLIIALFGEVPNLSGTVVVVVCHLLYWLSILVSLAMLPLATRNYQKLTLIVAPIVIHVLMHAAPIVFAGHHHDHDHGLAPIWRVCAGVVGIVAFYHETKCLTVKKIKNTQIGKKKGSNSSQTFGSHSAHRESLRGVLRPSMICLDGLEKIFN